MIRGRDRVTDEVVGSDLGDWVVDPFGEPLAVDLERDGSEWEKRLTALLRERATGGSIAARNKLQAQPPHVEYSLTNATLTSRLLAIPTEKGIYVLVAGPGEPTSDQVEPWADAAAAAQRELGTEHAPIEWSALIGPLGGGVHGDQPKAIEQEAQVGSLRLTPSGRAMTEAASKGGALFPHIRISEPVQVDGASRGYDWEHASVRALDELHVACGLLSIALDQYWTVRLAPVPNRGALVVPSTVNLPDGGPGIASWWHLSKVGVPAWVDAGFRRAQEDRRFRNRIAGINEAMAAEAEHPSLAAVAFVAVIETIGTLVVPGERCGTCGMQTGSGKAFRRALGLVMPADEAEQLGKTYGLRSRTAHEGQLHGDETRFGMFVGPSFWTRDPVIEFRWGQLRKLRSAARNLMMLDIRGELPPRDEATK